MYFAKSKKNTVVEQLSGRQLSVFLRYVLNASELNI